MITYDVIGGKRTVWAATESFYGECWKARVLSIFFDSSNMVHLVEGQSMFISMLHGGRVVYTGKEVVASHAGARARGLTNQHFDAFLKHFHASLDDVRVKPDKAEKVLKLLEGQRARILNS